MRGTLVLSLALVGALVLAGCSGGGDSSSSSSASSSSSGSAGNGTKSKTSTSSVPNIPPVIVLKVTDDAGAATNATFVTEGSKLKGNLTFSAVGSSDPDDTKGLSGISITVQDLNRTFPSETLYAGGAFTPVKFSFDRAGPVNVTVSGIDVRGDITTLYKMVYVNYKTKADSSKGFTVPAPPTDDDAAACGGSFDNQLIDNQFSDKRKFTTEKGVQWVEAEVIDGAGTIAICEPPATPDTAGAPISDGGTKVVSKPGTVFKATIGAEQYYIFMLAGSATPSQDGNKLLIDVVVHYDPQPAA